MDTQTLYDLLKLLSCSGRKVAAQQQGLRENDTVSCPSLHIDDVRVIKCFAERATAHTAVWQGMPQAGISLSDTARCCLETDVHSKFCLAHSAPHFFAICRCLNHVMVRGSPQTAVAAALIFSYLLKAPSFPVNTCAADAGTVCHMLTYVLSQSQPAVDHVMGPLSSASAAVLQSSDFRSNAPTVLDELIL